MTISAEECAYMVQYLIQKGLFRSSRLKTGLVFSMTGTR